MHVRTHLALYHLVLEQTSLNKRTVLFATSYELWGLCTKDTRDPNLRHSAGKLTPFV